MHTAPSTSGRLHPPHKIHSAESGTGRRTRPHALSLQRPPPVIAATNILSRANRTKWNLEINQKQKTPPNPPSPEKKEGKKKKKSWLGWVEEGVLTASIMMPLTTTDPPPPRPKSNSDLFPQAFFSVNCGINVFLNKRTLTLTSVLKACCMHIHKHIESQTNKTISDTKVSQLVL